jgi:molecular chaperone DnaK (HSP70)
VITVPAFFSDVQRQATRDAGEIAGLTVERIINEPTAAALAYECGHQEAKNILVYDLGGGTFDVSVVHLDSGVVEVRASHGDNHLGGDDFDHRLLEHICNFLEKEHGVVVKDSTRAISRINRAAETAKIALSSQPYYTIEEEYLLEKDGAPIHLSLEISRVEYEEMIADYIAQTLEAVHTALDGAGLRASDIDEILLVGGSTRTPLVQERLEAEMGMQPRLELDPDLCVAMGAAVQAGMMGGEKIGPILVDITPYTFGTSAIDYFNGREYPYCFIPLIRKNTPIPVTHSESFYTAFDDQKEIEVCVYQGENKDALNNTKIGSFLLEIQDDLPAGSPIVTTFSLDINGILNVSTLEKKSGHTQHLTIDNALSHFQENEMEQARLALQKLMEEDAYHDDGDDTDEEQETRERVKARALLEKARTLLPSLEGDDRDDAVDLIEAVEIALSGDDGEQLTQASNELSDFLYYIEPDLGAHN